MSVLSVIVLLAVVLAAPVSATPPTLAEGTDEFIFDWENRTAVDRGGNCIIEVKPATRIFRGTLDGAATDEELQVVVRGPCEGIYPGKFRDSGHTEGTFVGHVDGRYGTFRYVYVFQTYPGDPPLPSNRIVRGSMIILNNTGELVNLHGVLNVYLGGYSGNIHFDTQPQRVVPRPRGTDCKD